MISGQTPFFAGLHVDHINVPTVVTDPIAGAGDFPSDGTPARSIEGFSTPIAHDSVLIACGRKVDALLFHRGVPFVVNEFVKSRFAAR